MSGSITPLLLLALGLGHLAVLVWDPGRTPSLLRCDPAVLVDGALRCDGDAPRTVGALCGEGFSSDAPISSGDAIDRVAACDGAPDARGRMDADTLARLGVAVDINRAEADELASLPGIGPTIAQRVIEARPFASVDELERVKGIGPRTLERLRARARVER